MRFLIDQDVYRITIDELKEWGHDVVRAKELGMQQASDQDLLRKAREMDRLLITRDKDFGSLVFLEEKLLTGVILLRMVPVTVEEVHRELRRLFHEHSEEELKHLFCVVEPNRHRIRRLSG
jgi:predicted nuclease of predicted toxin-antitoxin system